MSFFKRNRASFILLFIAIIFIFLGVWREEFEVVFKKAVNICLECIGLG